MARMEDRYSSSVTHEAHYRCKSPSEAIRIERLSVRRWFGWRGRGIKKTYETGVFKTLDDLWRQGGDGLFVTVTF